jgi:hypothetical protein
MKLHEKLCCDCGKVKPVTEFYQYRYTTAQGKRSMRNASNCKACQHERYIARKVRLCTTK